MFRPELTLYYREGCHLCDQMLQALRGLQPRLGFGLHTVDVDGDPDMVDRYDERVPVLSLNGREICHYRLDEHALHEALRLPADEHSHGTHEKHGS